MSSSKKILRVGFQPQSDYAFDIEVLPANDWVKLIPKSHLNSPTRLDFHQLILVTKGEFRHWVDFQLEAVSVGSMLAVCVGQVQRFEANKLWDGWVIIFRPESIQSTEDLDSRSQRISVNDMPAQLQLNATSFSAVRETLVQMNRDASLAGQVQMVSTLMRAQLQTLLLRLLLVGEQQQTSSTKSSSTATHFKKFRDAIEKNLHQWHQVAAYSRALGISEKTLSRASQTVAGLSAKAYLSKRIALEAQRMLAYTNWPIAQVADKLGFDEATNFIKFFRREAGFAPGEFRKQHRSSESAL